MIVTMKDDDRPSVVREAFDDHPQVDQRSVVQKRSGCCKANFCFQNFDKAFWGKNSVSMSPRPSNAAENGYINAPGSNAGKAAPLDKAQRASQGGVDGALSSQQYGKTLNVPDSNSVLHNLPAATPPAPLVPPRPAIMSTPKSSMISLKNPSASISLSPTESRPLLLVTSESGQQQTKTVPHSRRLPVNGRVATMAATKQRQQPPVPSANYYQHQMVNENGPNQRPAGRKYVSSRPRAALFFASTRTWKIQQRESRLWMTRAIRRWSWSISRTASTAVGQ